MTYELMREIRRQGCVGSAKPAVAVWLVRLWLSSACMALLAVLAAQPLLAAENGAHDDPSQLDYLSDYCRCGRQRLGQLWP